MVNLVIAQPKLQIDLLLNKAVLLTSGDLL